MVVEIHSKCLTPLRLLETFQVHALAQLGVSIPPKIVFHYYYLDLAETRGISVESNLARMASTRNMMMVKRPQMRWS